MGALGFSFNWPWTVQPVDGDSEFAVLAKHLSAQFGMNGVHLVTDNALHAPAGGYYGIQVTTQCIVGNGAFKANLVEGNAFIGSTLDPGYHPIAGTEIQFSTPGQAYLLKNAKTNVNV